MDRLTVTLHQLRVFREVARTGSVRAAAEAMFVTPPSVSAAVAALEAELGVSLLEPEGRGIRLTEAGHELARHVASVLGLLDRTERAVREVGGGPGHLRLAAVTTAGEYVLPPLLAAFRVDHPATQVSLEVGNRGDIFARLLDREVDLALGGRPSHVGIDGEAIRPNVLVVVARPDHPLRERPRLDPARLSGETWLLREPGSGTRESSDEYLAAHGIVPSATMTVGSNGAIKQVAAVGLGITLMSLDAVRDEIEAGELSRLRVRGTPLHRTWHVLYRDLASLPPAASAFMDFLRARA